MIMLSYLRVCVNRFLSILIYVLIKSIRSGEDDRMPGEDLMMVLWIASEPGALQQHNDEQKGTPDHSLPVYRQAESPHVDEI